MRKETIIYYFHGRDVGFTRRFISCHVMVGFTRRFISYHVMVGFTRRFISCHVMVGFNRKVYWLPRCREVGFTRWFMISIWYGTLLVSD